jgi:hypothetical protein
MMKEIEMKPRNFLAKELRSDPKFRKQVVRDRTVYNRKLKHKKAA